MRESAAVNVLELAPDRYSVGDPACLDLARRRALAQEMSGGLAFDRGIGDQDDFTHLARIEHRLEHTRANLLGTDAIERREMPMQDEIAAAVAARLLDGHHVGG